MVIERMVTVYCQVCKVSRRVAGSLKNPSCQTCGEPLQGRVIEPRLDGVLHDLERTQEHDRTL